MEKKTKSIIASMIIVLVGYVLVDYINISSLIGFMPTNINIEIFGILFDTAVVLILYTISFYYIDNKQNEKDDNAKDTANILIKNTYQECLDNLELLDDRNMVKTYIMPKLDGNRPASENKVVNNLQEIPFASFSTIIDLAASGYVEKKKLDCYLNIKKEYRYLINIKITFFDLIEPKTDEQRVMYNNIQTRDFELKTKLQECITGIEL